MSDATVISSFDDDALSFAFEGCELSCHELFHHILIRGCCNFNLHSRRRFHLGRFQGHKRCRIDHQNQQTGMNAGDSKRLEPEALADLLPSISASASGSTGKSCSAALVIERVLNRSQGKN